MQTSLTLPAFFCLFILKKSASAVLVYFSTNFCICKRTLQKIRAHTHTHTHTHNYLFISLFILFLDIMFVNFATIWSEIMFVNFATIWSEKEKYGLKNELEKLTNLKLCVKKD